MSVESVSGPFESVRWSVEGVSGPVESVIWSVESVIDYTETAAVKQVSAASNQKNNLGHLA